MEKKQNPSGISPAEAEEKKAARIDAFLSVMIDATTSIIKTRPAQAAASISYYTLFSAFPLLLFLVVVLSYFLEISVIQKEIILILENILPGSETLVIENMQNILSSRLTTSITATISLLWSGSGALNSIIANIHMAWPETSGRGFFINRFFAVMAIILICFVLSGTIVFSMVFNISDALAFFDIQVNKFIQVLIQTISSVILPLVLIYFASYLLYYFVPTAKVDKEAARIGALVTSITWRIFTYIFSIYVLSPFNSYDVIYGSVAVIILLLLYVYIMAFIILFSAHLVAAITHYKAKQAERIQKAGDKHPLEQNLTGKAASAQPIPTNLQRQDTDDPDEMLLPSSQNRNVLSLRKFKKNIRFSIDRLPLRYRQEHEENTTPRTENAANKTFWEQAESVVSKLIHNLFRWK